MATIPNPGSELRHVRKTVTFTGAAGAGAVGTVTLFTLVGRVQLERMSAYCATGLTGATATLDLGLTGAATFWTGSGATLASDILTGKWWDSANAVARDAGSYDIIYGGTSQGMPASADIIATVGVANITGGVLVFDVWYRPITDDGALAGDDIDEDLKTNIWSKALSDIASVPAITASAKDALNWLFALARNKLTQTSTTQTLKKDDGTTTVGTASVSDDGTTFTRGEWS